jgi:putative transposase
MLIAEQFIQSLVRKYGKHLVSTERVCDTWYPQTYKFLKLKHHHIHLPYGKSIIERTI